MKQGIAVAGNIIVDHVKMIDTFPSVGMLANIRGVSQCIGGCAGNTSVNLSLIDPSLPVFCIGKVGDDSMGEYAKSFLIQHGIDTCHVKTSSLPTSFTDVMSDVQSGERTFFHLRGANADFGIEDVDLDNLHADIFHVGYALLLDRMDQADRTYGTAMARLLAMVREKGIKTSLDVVSEDGNRFSKIVTPSLRYCSYAIMNEVEAGMVCGVAPRDHNGQILIRSLKEICNRIMDCGVEEYVVLHMPELGCAMDAERNFYAVGSYRLPAGYIKGSVGAGDAFCAGSLYGLYTGMDVTEMLIFANGAAACNLSHENSVGGMKIKADIQGLPYPLRTVEKM